MFKIKNITSSRRKFTESKTGQIYYVEAGKSITTKFKPIEDRPDVFEVKEIRKEDELEKVEKQKKRIKGG